MENYYKPPKPTPSELKLRKILERKQVPFYYGKVIWYTSCDCFTPDLLIRKSNIIEVDGKVHNKEHRKTLDRLRQRVLENKGYTVHRIKNDQISTRPDDIAEQIKEIYLQLSENENKIKPTISESKKPLKIEPIPKDVNSI
jgi:hypothetical protein